MINRESGREQTRKYLQEQLSFLHLHYIIINNNDWSLSHNYDYWNIYFTSGVGENNDETIKNIYDPCVSGFTLPKTAAFTSFTSTGYSTTSFEQYNVSGSFNKGWNFYTMGWKNGETIFFGSMGCRRNESGNIDEVLVDGHFWKTGAASSSTAYSMWIDAYYVFPQNKDEILSLGTSIMMVTANYSM